MNTDEVMEIDEKMMTPHNKVARKIAREENDMKKAKLCAQDMVWYEKDGDKLLKKTQKVFNEKGKKRLGNVYSTLAMPYSKQTKAECDKLIKANPRPVESFA